MTEKAPGCPSTGVMGTVSTHRVKEPHRCTWGGCPRHDQGPPQRDHGESDANRPAHVPGSLRNATGTWWGRRRPSPTVPAAPLRNYRRLCFISCRIYREGVASPVREGCSANSSETAPSPSKEQGCPPSARINEEGDRWKPPNDGIWAQILKIELLEGCMSTLLGGSRVRM